MGELLVNYSELVFKQKVQLKNIPSGTCTITLTAEDLGNFVVHEILKEPTSKVRTPPVCREAAPIHRRAPRVQCTTPRCCRPCAAPPQAVKGEAFHFDRSSVRFVVDPITKEGSVFLEGEYAGDDW